LVYRIHRGDEVGTAHGRVVVVGLEVSLPDMFRGGGLVGKGGLADEADELLKRVIVEMAQDDGTSWRCNVRPKRMMKKKPSCLRVKESW
jgi:hypothetical protein